ncbi:unnamed protein product [Macrosiphum euphorbiae]|uniref:Uncharacterized protein n=1 Tax=Macrosiphum euphorbiae TaxID=13131 RepID=A0AAV0XMI1_9HEMI|nr:unnamed protein product [Macrosiphum euphorbiae]
MSSLKDLAQELQPLCYNEDDDNNNSNIMSVQYRKVHNFSRVYRYGRARTHDEEMFPVGSSAAGPDGVQLKAAAPELEARLTPD